MQVCESEIFRCRQYKSREIKTHCSQEQRPAPSTITFLSSSFIKGTCLDTRHQKSKHIAQSLQRRKNKITEMLTENGKVRKIKTNKQKGSPNSGRLQESICPFFIPFDQRALHFLCRTEMILKNSFDLSYKMTELIEIRV